MDPTQTLNENTEDVIDVKSKGLINGKKIGVKRKDNVNVNNAQRKKSKNGLNQNASINNAVVDEKKAKLPKNLRLEKLAAAYRTIIELVGEDPNREGVLKTPMRAAKAMLTFTQGYGMDLTTHSEAIFTEKDCDDMVVVRDIHISSLCEHHLVPFIGKCHIGYLPNGRVLGLSKFCRIADMYSQRLQVQERLTRNIAEALMDILKPRGVAVVIEASHMCMVMRGVRQHSANTVTSTVLGEFREKDRTRAEFLSIIKGNSFSSVR